MERHLDFDTIIERKGTDCLKYDFAKEMRKEENLIPLWVADMDLKVSSYICDAIKQQADNANIIHNNLFLLIFHFLLQIPILFQIYPV